MVAEATNPTLPETATPPADDQGGSVIRFDASQRRLFLDQARVIVVNWHRQKGKDFTAAAKAVDDALRTGQDWYIVSLTQRQADATFQKCLKVAKAFARLLAIQTAETQFTARDKWIDQEFVFKAREIIFPNGARVISLPGRDPDTLAGLTGNVIFTEFGLFPGGGYEHWGVVFPITTRGYKVIVISTPRGKNTKFFELFSDAETYSVHFCDIYQSVEQEGFVLRDQHGQPTTIAAFRKLYNDESKWPREYECKFTGDLESLVKWAQLITAAELGSELPFDLLEITNDSGWDATFFKQSIPAGSRLEIGWDVARTGHLSSLWCNCGGGSGGVKQPKQLRFLVIMRNTTFGLQREVVSAAMDARGRGSGVGCGDATGLGMDSNETLERRYRDRWEPVNFGGLRKGELGSIGATTYGDSGQAIPSLEGPHKFIATDIYAVQKIEARGGGANLKLDETDNPLLPDSHCDIAYSNFLALRAGTNLKGKTLPAPLAVKPVGW